MGDFLPSLELPPEAVKNHAMEKITDKIAALPAGQHYFSLEFFPPKTAMGFSNLRSRLERMARALRPLFVNVTWGAGGSTATKSLELAEICQRELGLTTCLHLTCTNMSRRLIDKALDDAKALGIRNILALRGDPPRRAEYRDINKPEPEEEEEFSWAVDLVRYIRKTHGDYFCIGVAAYPEGHADESHPLGQSLEHDLPYLVEKTQAGADFIMTQLFFDIEAYKHFEKTLREHPSGAFKDMPILPGLMPIQSYQMIKRTTKLSHAKIPESLMARLDAVRGDDEKVKEVGVDILSEIVEQIKEVKSRTEGPRGFHFYTLNLEKAVSFIVERTGLIAPLTPDDESAVIDQNLLPDIRLLRISGSTPDQSSHDPLRRKPSVGSDPRDRVIVQGRSASHPDWEATALEASVPAEPINSRANTLAISEGEGVLGREATWDDFPNGRWGDARSPAYGQIDGYGVTLHVTVAQARQLWGSPTTPEDVSAIFIRHLRGELETIPWSEESFSAETDTIRDRLVALNSKGWWTLASQPAVNGLRSSDPTFGWGPQNGFVFQKAFVEFFLPSKDWEVLERKLKRPEMRDVVSFYATNAKGDFVSSDTALPPPPPPQQHQGATSGAAVAEREASTNAVTWGVFPGKEIVTPTIIEEVSFRAWSEEAFGIWSEWAKIYEKGSASERFLESVRADAWLVNIIHHEYVDPDALWDFLL
ncbi:methylenetetrahydrofolate reductase-domain-containing protein [Corynascus novoguineensis]|uniref:Methylenetetrahydrofolate reductase-domain-containing protein n=1 Tax=Corynascus novoguineensis TaxID=1126955 RepID=A0AAN7CZ22_9PEZI|nr:methylenetetrahydrofolate reductase-domain-containing protein [Corynascus novoguineensis]